MSDTDTSQTLLEVVRIRRSTRELLDQSWFAFLIWGSLVMISAPFTQIGDGGAAIGIYWFVASPIGVAATAIYYRRRQLSLGLFDRFEPVYIAIVAAMVIGAMLVGALGDGAFAEVGPIYPIAAGLLGFGLLISSALIAATATALAAVATALLVSAPQDAALHAALSEGAIMLVAGAIALAGDRSRGPVAGEGPAVAPGG